MGPQIPLAPPRLKGVASVEEALQQRRSVRSFAVAALDLQDVAQLLWAAQGVTHPEGHRTAPSAGALRPLVVYLVAGNVAGLAPGVYRYQPQEHALVLTQPADARGRLASAALGQASVRDAPAVLVIAAVYARTAQKYGARAERYVHIEVGHAAQNVYLQATARGLGTVLVGAFDDLKVREALGLPADHASLGLMPLGRRAPGAAAAAAAAAATTRPTSASP
ncbi:MAG: SagB/ThcOx family dehydrogenase [Rubrivivax sp.]|nr:SagB/ThcOx family dehydrogenase [Rubrivivax sp.]